MAEFIGNRYRIVKLIGKGGMADVYLAFDTILKREVAVKVLKSDMADDVVALERFKREAGAVTQLSHPNIVDVYDVGDDGDVGNGDDVGISVGCWQVQYKVYRTVGSGLVEQGYNNI